MARQQKTIPIHHAKAAVRILPTHELVARTVRKHLSAPLRSPAHPRPAPSTARGTLIDPGTTILR